MLKCKASHFCSIFPNSCYIVVVRLFVCLYARLSVQFLCWFFGQLKVIFPLSLSCPNKTCRRSSLLFKYSNNNGQQGPKKSNGTTMTTATATATTTTTKATTMGWQVDIRGVFRRTFPFSSSLSFFTLFLCSPATYNFVIYDRVL